MEQKKKPLESRLKIPRAYEFTGGRIYLGRISPARYVPGGFLLNTKKGKL